jgi:NADPH2:quinone reductase
MRAFALTAFGSAPEVIDLERPEPGDGEVRVRVHAASVNGFDQAVALGYVKDVMEHRFPVVLGKDFAGTVDAVGPEVSDFQAGDRVFGVVTKPYLGDGSFGEYVIVPTSIGIAHLPAGIDFVEGASLGLAGAAAIAAVDAAALQPDQTVLVAGATGGVGNQIVQLAARAGARVVATAGSAEEKSLVADLGAGVTVDYVGDVSGLVREVYPEGVDVVFHLAGDPTTLLAAARPGGAFVSTLLGSPEQLPSEEVRVIGIYANPDSATLHRAADHRAGGETRLEIQGTYPLEDAASALAAFAEGTLGKVVITLD